MYPSNSVTVLDNASYHKPTTVSTSNTRKQNKIQWLIDNGEPCDSTLTTPELNKLIKENKPVESA